MGFFIANTSGPFDSASTWSGAGIPTLGDSGHINANVLVTLSGTSSIGVAGLTTGSIALNIANGGRLLLNTGTLNLYGDINITTGSTLPSSIVMNGGSNIVFNPSNNQRIKIGFGNQKHITINGTSQNNCAIYTDPVSLNNGGLKSHFSLPGGGAVGVTCLHNIKYCNFADMDDGSTVGMFKSSIALSGFHLNIENCTFLRCGGFSINVAGPVWNNDFIIKNNIYKSGTGTNYGNGNVAMNLSLSLPYSGGKRLFCNNDFDKNIQLSDGRFFEIYNNVITDTGTKAIIGASQTFGNSWRSFYNNLIASDTEESNLMSAFGDVSGCLLLNGKSNNPHFISTFPSSRIYNNIIECYSINNLGNGDSVLHSFTNTNAPCIVDFNIILPSYASGTSAGTITNMYTIAQSSIIIEHNTIYCGGQYGLNIGESNGNMVANGISYVRGNIFWSKSSTSVGKIYDVGSAPHTTDMINPTNADYNASYNLETSTPYPASPYTNTGKGYNSNFSSVPGSNDLDSQNPTFILPSACVSVWWISQKGGANTNNLFNDTKSAINYIRNDPENRIRECREWIQGCFRPTNSNYANKTSSFDSQRNYTVDPLGVDLNGTIGAISYISQQSNNISVTFFNIGMGKSLIK